MLVVETIARIRREALVKGKGIKAIARELHVSRNTVRRVLRSGETAFVYEREVQPLPAHEHDPDPKLRPYAEPIDAERREQLIVGVAAGVTAIYRHFEPHRRLAARSARESATYRRALPKTGRNDPCPCGSGKKYKQCCGKVTLH
jgi:AraC-like DNA-binding protein